MRSIFSQFPYYTEAQTSPLKTQTYRTDAEFYGQQLSWGPSSQPTSTSRHAIQGIKRFQLLVNELFFNLFFIEG